MVSTARTKSTGRGTSAAKARAAASAKARASYAKSAKAAKARTAYAKKTGKAAKSVYRGGGGESRVVYTTPEGTSYDVKKGSAGDIVIQSRIEAKEKKAPLIPIIRKNTVDQMRKEAAIAKRQGAKEYKLKKPSKDPMVRITSVGPGGRRVSKLVKLPESARDVVEQSIIGGALERKARADAKRLSPQDSMSMETQQREKSRAEKVKEQLLEKLAPITGMGNIQTAREKLEFTRKYFPKDVPRETLNLAKQIAVVGIGGGVIRGYINAGFGIVETVTDLGGTVKGFVAAAKQPKAVAKALGEQFIIDPAATITEFIAFSKGMNLLGRAAKKTPLARYVQEEVFIITQPKEIRPAVRAIIKSSNVQRKLNPAKVPSLTKADFLKVKSLNAIEATALIKTLKQTDSVVFGSLAARGTAGRFKTRLPLPKDVDLATRSVKAFSQKFIQNMPKKLRSRYKLKGEKLVKVGQKEALFDVKSLSRIVPEKSILTKKGILPVSGYVRKLKGVEDIASAKKIIDQIKNLEFKVKAKGIKLASKKKLAKKISKLNSELKNTYNRMKPTDIAKVKAYARMGVYGVRTEKLIRLGKGKLKVSLKFKSKPNKFGFKRDQYSLSKHRSKTLNEKDLQRVNIKSGKYDYHKIDVKKNLGVIIPKDYHVLLHAIENGFIRGKTSNFYKVLRKRTLGPIEAKGLDNLLTILKKDVPKLTTRFDKASKVKLIKPKLEIGRVGTYRVTGFGEQTLRKGLGTLQVLIEKNVRRAKDPQSFLLSLKIQRDALKGAKTKTRLGRLANTRKIKKLNNAIKLLESKSFARLLERKVPGLTKEFPLVAKIKTTKLRTLSTKTKPGRVNKFEAITKIQKRINSKVLELNQLKKKKTTNFKQRNKKVLLEIEIKRLRSDLEIIKKSPSKDFSSKRISNMVKTKPSKLPKRKKPSRLPSRIPKKSKVPSRLPKKSKGPSRIPKKSKGPSRIPKRPKVPSKIPKRSKVPSRIPKRPKVPSKIPKVPKSRIPGSRIPGRPISRIPSGIPSKIPTIKITTVPSKKLLNLPERKKREKLERQFIKEIRADKFIYFPDLYAKFYGIKASKTEKKELLKPGKVFTGVSVRKLV